MSRKEGNLILLFYNNSWIAKYESILHEEITWREWTVITVVIGFWIHTELVLPTTFKFLCSRESEPL